MAIADREVDLTGLVDPQRPIALVVGVVLIGVGVVGLTGVLDFDIEALSSLGDGLVLGLFGIPFWLGVTAIVAGLLGVLLSFYAGAATTFNKVASTLVLPPVLLLAITDWAIANGGIVPLVVGGIALVIAVVFVVVAVVLLVGNVLALVHPIVAVLAIADWTLGLSAMAPASEPANLPTLGLLLILTIVLGAVAFEGGRRLTGNARTAG